MTSSLGRHRDEREVTCSIERTLDVVGDRWSYLIIRQVLLYNSSKFTEFETSLGIAPGILADRLGRLVDAGILEKKAYQDDGARSRARYLATDAGRGLLPVLIAMQQWGDEQAPLSRGASLLRRSADNGRPLHLALVDDRGEVVAFDRLRWMVAPGFDIPTPVSP